MTTPQPRHVFISYSRRDEAVMRRVVNFLRGQGIKVWVDNEKLVPGTATWKKAIEKALKKSFAIVVLLSPASYNSTWVGREISFAESHERTIFPILVDGNEKNAVPITLVNHQRIDMRENEEVALATLSESLENFFNVLAQKEQLVKEKTESETPEKTTREKDKDNLTIKKEDVIRNAREREQLERALRLQTSTAAPKKVRNQKPHPQLWKRRTFLLGGIILLTLLCSLAGKAAWPFVFPPLTQTKTPVVSTPSYTPTALVGPTRTIPSPTSTPPSTLTPTVTPFSPQDPDQFIIFYFETIIYDKDYILGWSLLTETFRQKNNPDGYDDWKAVWENVVGWDRPIMATEYITSSKAIVSTPSMTFYSSTKYSLPDQKLCLVRDESRNTWLIAYKGTCDL